MKPYKFVEVPIVGYTLVENPWTFGYKEIFKKNYSLEVYKSKKPRISTLEEMVKTEAKKGKIKTIFLGIGTAGTAATASSAVASVLGLVCSGGACPLWLGAMFSTLMPFAWVPVAATGGVVVAKKLGGRKGLQHLADSFTKEFKTLDYEPLKTIIQEKDLLSKTSEYYMSKIVGTRKQKFKRIFKRNPKLKQLKQDLKEGYQELTDTSYEMFKQAKEEKEAYKALYKTYNYITKGFQGKVFRTKSYVLFGY